MYLADIYTLPPSLAGLPAISTPAGFSPDGLPIGLQLTGPAFSEARLVALAAAFEAATDHATKVPPGF
jgi:aspartyl-tRNA(Asn)/glutamyl-tRNA(Gln) amidotransferase subunit A